MTLFYSSGPPLVEPADDVTCAQFFLGDVAPHPVQPARRVEIPSLIEEETGKRVFFEEICSRTQWLARGLKARYGIGEGDVVSIFSPNHIDYIVCLYAVHRLGAVLAASSPALTADEFAYQMELGAPSVLVVHADLLVTALEAARAVKLPTDRILVLDAHKSLKPIPLVSLESVIYFGQTAPDFKERKLERGEGKTKLAVLSFSSGTTGKPKAVAISHYNIIVDVVMFGTFMRLNEDYAPWDERRFRPGDVSAGVIPFSHIYGIIANLQYMVWAGVTVVVSQKFVFEKFLESISRYRITHMMIVPPQAVLLCKHPASRKYDLSSLRYCMVAAAPLTEELTSQLLERLPGIHLGQGYGMTETTAAVSIWPLEQKVGTLGSVGQLLPGTVARVVKPDGTLAGVGEPGELQLKGGQMVSGYYKNEAATKDTFVDGWLRTGDEVVFRENGDLFIVDRIKELIKVKGNQVAPAELEGHLLDHEDIADAGVVGVPDDYAGELPFAFVVLKPDIAPAVKGNGHLEKEVRKRVFDHVANTKSAYKQLKGGIVFVDAIPKTASGKILRRELRDHAKKLAPAVRSKL